MGRVGELVKYGKLGGLEYNRALYTVFSWNESKWLKSKYQHKWSRALPPSNVGKKNLGPKYFHITL